MPKVNQDKLFEIKVCYYKKGDDQAFLLEECGGNVVESLRSHAAVLRLDAETLEAVAFLIDSRKEEVTLEADGHMLIVSGSEEFTDELVKRELAVEMDMGDEEEEDESYVKDENETA